MLLVPVVTAAPAFADTAPTATPQHASTESPTPGSASEPTPAPQAPDYGAKPETVLLGVPIEGTLYSVQGAQSILPGSGPRDYA